ncbi:MAG: efflux RND transporter periplasmic adaptor subunit [Phycisphaerales bacterium]|nr:efflux RND transporter periplasmic adaptor subunit [Phycisphaerales bacterium]
MSAPRLAVLAFFALAACEPASRGAGASAGQSAARPPKPVRLVAAAAAALPTKVAVSGLLAAQEELVLGMEVGGRLASLACDVGDAVAAGQLLAALDERDFQLAIERAEAAVAAAEARLGLGPDAPLDRFDLERAPSVREAQAVVVEAQLNRERVAKLVEGSLQAAAQLETATAVLAVAENRLHRARDDVRTWLAEAQLRRIERTQAQKRLLDAQVKAPWAGRVAVRHVAAGQVVQAGAAVVTLLRTEPLRLRMRVPDRLAFGIAAGQRVEFTVDGADGVDRVGKVVRVGPAIDRDDRTRLVEAEVGNADGALLPGAFCRARIVVAEAAPVVTVPKAAVATFAGVDRVFTVAKDKDGGLRAKGVLVELGRPVGDAIEVVRGVAVGDRVVAESVGLAPEAPVQVVE